ncbi:helix-turn-helix domain-containing protein [Propionibacteriaceae bacterium Y1923]
MITTHSSQPHAMREVKLAGLGFTATMSDWAGEFADDYDWAAIREAYNRELDARAPEGVHWGWSEHAPWCYAPVSVQYDTIAEAWAAAIAPGGEGGIDFEAIAVEHEFSLPMHPFAVALGHRVRDRRQAAGMTGRQLADLLGATEERLVACEAGRVGFLLTEAVDAAAALGTGIVELMAEAERSALVRPEATPAHGVRTGGPVSAGGPVRPVPHCPRWCTRVAAHAAEAVGDESFLHASDELSGVAGCVVMVACTEPFDPGERGDDSHVYTDLDPDGIDADGARAVAAALVHAASLLSGEGVEG